MASVKDAKSVEMMAHIATSEPDASDLRSDGTSGDAESAVGSVLGAGAGTSRDEDLKEEIVASSPAQAAFRAAKKLSGDNNLGDSRCAFGMSDVLAQGLSHVEPVSIETQETVWLSVTEILQGKCHGQNWKFEGVIIDFDEAPSSFESKAPSTVSYTHLTLPTKRLV